MSNDLAVQRRSERIHQRPPRRGSRESLTRSFGTLGCRTMRSPNTFVGFDLANWSSSSKWSCTNVVGCVVDGGAHEQRRSRIMAKREYHTEQTEGATPFGLIPAVLITMGRQHTHECAKVHSELVDRFRDANRSWLKCLQSEADLSVEFTSKMALRRSIPGAAAVVLDWTSRHMEMATVDAKHVLADTQ